MIPKDDVQILTQGMKRILSGFWMNGKSNLNLCYY